MLEQEHFKVLIFVGEKQAKVTFEVAAALQRMGSKATYVKIAGAGPNALDFHIAFYIGPLAAAEPDAHFHIISKDTGFDPLIAHLKSRIMFAARSKEVTQIPIVKVAMAQSPEGKQAAVLANLQQRGSSKPRTVKTLLRTINSPFQKALSDEELSSLLQSLQQRGVISMTVPRCRMHHLGSICRGDVCGTGMSRAKSKRDLVQLVVITLALMCVSYAASAGNPHRTTFLLQHPIRVLIGLAANSLDLATKRVCTKAGVVMPQFALV